MKTRIGFMNTLLVLMLVLFLPCSLAQENIFSNGTASLEFGTLPTSPVAGSATILVFEASDTQQELSHIDAYATIYNPVGEMVKQDYEMHSHGNQFSMPYTFQDAGEYTLSIEITASEHYEGPDFESFSFTIPIEVEAKEQNNLSLIWVFGIGILLAVAIFLLLKLKKSKK